MVRDAKKLRQNYLNSKHIILNIVSILPTDVAYIYFGYTCYETMPCPVIVRYSFAELIEDLLFAGFKLKFLQVKQSFENRSCG